ncbi:MAG: T9SS type A sorting domain-containing protein [Flavobacteriia bacterium]|nr:T9SS type A sorting domain-containing protein [Flavobacteriia bacterium]
MILKPVKLIILILSFSLTSFYFSQENGELKYCGQHLLHQKNMQNPDYAQQYLLDQQELSALQQIVENNPELQRGTVYKIPIVFHVLHNNGVENISREQILDALRILNRDYRKLNADTATVQSEFRPLIADIEVEFVLATKAPNGNCFNGITRTQSVMTYDGNDGYGQVTAIKNGNDVYQGEWPGNKYLNIFICADLGDGGAAGYTSQPSNWSGTSMTNGIWVLHDYVGSIGTGGEGTDRTLTHEAGHWLNLAHTWGDTNEPGLASNCNTDDGVTDTPNTRGVTSCNLNENYCGPKANVENYMDYSYCSKMFTTGQKNRIRAALVSSVGGRNNLWQAANLTATGADGTLTLCNAEFSSNKNVVCVGDEVNFTDLSYNAVESWSWNFEGALLNQSNVQNPTVMYSTPGEYDVTLNAHFGSETKTTTKSNWIKVLPQSDVIPFFEGFEAYSSLINNPKWSYTNPQNNQAFDITNIGHTGSKSVKLTNYNQSADSEDELLAPPVDLSDVSGTVTLTFRFSYRKKASANNEKLQVLGSNNCGNTWNVLKNISGTNLGSQVVTNAWTPANQSEWTTAHVTGVSSQYFVNNFLYKFKFTSDGGNNIYIDDINIYNGTQSTDIVYADSDNDGTTNDIDEDDDNDGVLDINDAFPFDPTETTDTDGDGMGNNTDTDDDNDTVADVDDPAPLDPYSPFATINELQNDFVFEVYPNPADDEIVVEYTMIHKNQTKIEIRNAIGQIVQSHNVMSNSGKNLVFLDIKNIEVGLYTVLIQNGSQQSYKKLLIK